MRYFAYFIVILLVMAFNFGILAPLGFGWAVPSTLLLLVVGISMEQGNADFIFFAILGGLWMDIYNSLPIGSFLGAYLLAGWGGYVLSGRLLAKSSGKYYVLFVLAAELLLVLWLWAYTNVMFHSHYGLVAVSGRQLLHHAWALFLYALVLALPIYSLVNAAARASKRWLRQPMQIS
jgi:hypothetical protein